MPLHHSDKAPGEQMGNRPEEATNPNSDGTTTMATTGTVTATSTARNGQGNGEGVEAAIDGGRVMQTEASTMEGGENRYEAKSSSSLTSR